MLENIKYNSSARKDFITLNRGVVKEWVSGIVGHKVVYGISDEFSIGILAFNEAIDKFNGNGNFYVYALQLVQSKLSTYLRNNNKEKHKHKAENKAF